MCLNSLGSHGDLFGHRLCVKENRRDGEIPTSQSKRDFVIAGFHNVSSVAICDPTLKKLFFFLCFENNPLEKRDILICFVLLSYDTMQSSFKLNFNVHDISIKTVGEKQIGIEIIHCESYQIN